MRRGLFFSFSVVWVIFFISVCCFSADTFASETGIKGDINGDGKIGLEEVIYALRINSGISNEYAEWLSSLDFSKAYVVPGESQVDKVTLGGILSLEDNKFYTTDFTLRDAQNLNILEMRAESSVENTLEQNLRNTVWKGTYDVHDDTYTTTLNLAVVQDGYVGGEVFHDSEIADTEPEYAGSLHARVTGDIINQYQISGTFTDEDRIDPSVLAELPTDMPVRQLVRIKRVRGLKIINGNDNSVWSTNREYRMTLEGNTLTGIVGIPADIYGSSDGTSDNGDINLTLSE